METVKYSLTLFGPKTALKPIPENFTYFINNLSIIGTTVPNIVQEFNQNGQTNSFQMRTIDNTWTVTFLTDKINIEWTNKFDGDFNIEQFISISLHIIQIINNKMNQIFSRVGFSSSYVFNKLSESKIQAIYLALNTSNGLNNGINPLEWCNRTVLRKDIDTGISREKINCVSEVRTAEGYIVKNGVSEDLKGILFDLDINTFQGNTDFRFDINNLNDLIKLLASEKEESIKYINSIVSN